MRWIVRIVGGLIALAILAAVVWFGGLGPRAFTPGGVLWGEVREAPADWSFTDAIAEIQVQTHVGPLPWSVTTWVLSVDGDLFVAAGNCDRVWTNQVLEDPEVRVRIDGVVYEMLAKRTTDRVLAAKLAPVVLAKYMGITAESATWIEGQSRGCIFALEPRG